jgi:hypothetical protein
MLNTPYYKDLIEKDIKNYRKKSEEFSLSYFNNTLSNSYSVANGLDHSVWVGDKLYTSGQSFNRIIKSNQMKEKEDH